MDLRQVSSFAQGHWVSPDSAAREICDAATGQPIALAGCGNLDPGGMRDYARTRGGPALWALTFHDRARMLKALALHLSAHKDALYDLSYATGATLRDHRFDIDGGIGTMLVIAAKGRREMPDDQVYLDGPVEQLSRGGTFLGQHICTPLQGVAVQINAFNFPVWGMLEKFAPAILAGMPVIVKPATATCYVTELAVRMMLDSGILPKGALQLICGGTGDLLDLLDSQDVVGFTGSAETAVKLRAGANILQQSIRFVAEQDSLNASILGPDVTPDSAEFGLFIKQAQHEMTTKAGQKCTAIRRIMVPERLVDPVIKALLARLAKVRIGDPRHPDTQMGALVSQAQRADVLAKVALIATEAGRVSGDPAAFTVHGADAGKGAFVPPMLFHCADPDAATHVHATEAFGPVATIMPYRDLPHAIDLAARGQGSLVASVITRDGNVARAVALDAAAFHGRLYFNNADSMGDSTGHGAPMPQMVHGGPGRAGGGEELGGVRAVMHYMQRTAVQGSPDILAAIGARWVPGTGAVKSCVHPFRKVYGALVIGETITTASRIVTSDDIAQFAAFTGDTFYAHMDDAAAARNPFFPGRVAHGYLLLSFAAGLFVDPDEGPVLANTGLDHLRFMKPVQPGTAIKVTLTVMAKTPRTSTYGEVRWHVAISDDAGDDVARYELLTMNSF